jgi:hypothetical protein
MAEHPNVDRFQKAAAGRLLSKPSQADLAATDDLFAEGIVWHDAPSGGDVAGKKAVVELWNAYARGEFGGPKLRLARVYADGNHGVLEFEVTSADDQLHVMQVLVLELDEAGQANAIWGMEPDSAIVKAFAIGTVPPPHPHLALFEIAEDVRNRQSFEPADMAVLHRFLDENVTWHGAGNSQFKDGAHPRENVIALYKLFKQYSNGTFAMHYSGMYAGDDHAVSFVKLTADIGPKHMDFDEVNLFHLHPDGSTWEFWGIAEDQDAVDAFWAS